jgi:hypothetical protein
MCRRQEEGVSKKRTVIALYGGDWIASCCRISESVVHFHLNCVSGSSYQLMIGAILRD